MFNSFHETNSAESQRLIPESGLRVANALLDLVTSQDIAESTETNERAFAMALEGANAPDDTGDLVAAAVVCVAWSIAHLAAERGTDTATPISELRAFLRENAN